MTHTSGKCLEIGQVNLPSFSYTICTLVTNHAEYESLVSSFSAGGFSFGDCEYLYADNSTSNSYDAYSGYNQFLLASMGEYIILCHQDILLLEDSRRQLDRIISEMNVLDPHWAVLGNAGGLANGDLRIRISDPNGENRNCGPFPALVQSVDENFIVVRRSANLALSHDLSGFHFYGTDLCLIATTLGYTSYVVDFHLRHHSGGTKDLVFLANRRDIATKYANILHPRWVRTTCTHFYLSGNRWLSHLLNSRLMMKAIFRFPKVIRWAMRAIGFA